jgi:hypothetical protein
MYQLMRLEERGFGSCKEAQRLRVKLSGGEPETIKCALDKEQES